MAKHRKTGTECAIKLVKKNSIEGKPILQDLLQNEIKVLQKIQHPNIVDIYELVHDPRYYCFA